jgi:hypothetical protein
MESLKSEVVGAYSSRQPLYFVAAGAMLLSAILDFTELHNYVKLVSGLSLAAVFTLMATWGPRPIGYQKVIVWTLLIVALVLIVGRRLFQ